MVCHSPLGLDYLGMSARTNCLSHSGKGMERKAWRSNWIHFKLEIWCLKGSLFSPIRFSCFAVIECMPVASIHATSSQQKMRKNWIPNVQISQESGTWQSDATSIGASGHGRHMFKHFWICLGQSVWPMSTTKHCRVLAFYLGQQPPSPWGRWCCPARRL